MMYRAERKRCSKKLHRSASLLFIPALGMLALMLLKKDIMNNTSVMAILALTSLLVVTVEVFRHMGMAHRIVLMVPLLIIIMSLVRVLIGDVPIEKYNGVTNACSYLGFINSLLLQALRKFENAVVVSNQQHT